MPYLLDVCRLLVTALVPECVVIIADVRYLVKWRSYFRISYLLQDPQLPISDYNYTALRDRLKKKGIIVSAATITDQAKKLGCYKPHPKGKAHDREVVTAAIGTRVQHAVVFYHPSKYLPHSARSASFKFRPYKYSAVGCGSTGRWRSAMCAS